MSGRPRKSERTAFNRGYAQGVSHCLILIHSTVDIELSDYETLVERCGDLRPPDETAPGAPGNDSNEGKA